MRKQKLRQLLAVLLTLCLLLGCVPAVFAADQTKELELQQTPVSISPENENVETDAADEPAPEETVRVIIRFRQRFPDRARLFDPRPRQQRCGTGLQ